MMSEFSDQILYIFAQSCNHIIGEGVMLSMLICFIHAISSEDEYDRSRKQPARADSELMDVSME